MLLSYTIVVFFIYYINEAVDMQICALLTRSQCLSDLCFGVEENILKAIMHFHYMT